jgi:hypothetical protein
LKTSIHFANNVAAEHSLLHNQLMRKRAKLAILGAFGMIALLVAALVPREPSYEGRTMGEWLGTQDRAKANEALVILATNNFPLLVRRLGYNRQEDYLLRAMAILPVRLGGRITSQRVLRRLNVASQAASVLDRIGTNSAPILPQLAEVAAGGETLLWWRVLPVLSKLGDDGLVVLASIASTNRDKAGRALALLGDHPESKVGRQALTNLLHNPDPEVRGLAYARVTNSWYALHASDQTK